MYIDYYYYSTFIHLQTVFVYYYYYYLCIIFLVVSPSQMLSVLRESPTDLIGKLVFEKNINPQRYSTVGPNNYTLTPHYINTTLH